MSFVCLYGMKNYKHLEGSSGRIYNKIYDEIYRQYPYFETSVPVQYEWIITDEEINHCDVIQIVVSGCEDENGGWINSNFLVDIRYPAINRLLKDMITTLRETMENGKGMYLTSDRDLLRKHTTLTLHVQ
jgi:hypothetical protein